MTAGRAAAEALAAIGTIGAVPGADLNLYPVKTRNGSRIVRNLRLRSNARGTVVWQLDRESGEVREFLRSAVEISRVGATQSWQVDGVVFEPQRGCGCNHPMYTWVPPADG